MSVLSGRRRPPDLMAFFQAVRPPFLVLTAISCLIGWATSVAQGIPFQPGYAAATLVLAVLAHAAANVWNDCGDAVIGTDALNSKHIAPYTGGSRVIQNGGLSALAMHRYAIRLAALSIGGGLILVALRGPGLLTIGLAGALIGFAYSAPALALMSRGLGELAVGVSWALVVVGADFVQRGHFAVLPVIASGSLALLVAALLSINQIPDIDADRACGKRTLAVRLGVRATVWVHALFTLGAYAWLGFAIARGLLPGRAACAVLALPAGLVAMRGAFVHVSAHRRSLAPALHANVLHVLGHGVLLAFGLWLAAP